MTPRFTLLHAAAIIEREAEALFRAHWVLVGGRFHWANDTPVQVRRDHADMIATAKALREMADE
jgi:hypothetical protein